MPRDRRLDFDSYTVAADISRALTRAGFDRNDPALQPPTI